MKTATVHVITDRKERIPIDVLITPTIVVPIWEIRDHRQHARSGGDFRSERTSDIYGYLHILQG
ncbi:hypothetical protein DPMN_126053 [Dreissena polymorpha]|uniref:Uncharacterized protein n=1 Tax=Dreissena polymorpha TaxID=45954 RepID=A0A9D4H2K9_DREPO|nr:hypothetical protein DPMN_126053 [Dreissena polymorpha]